MERTGIASDETSEITASTILCWDIPRPFSRGDNVVLLTSSNPLLVEVMSAVRTWISTK